MQRRAGGGARRLRGAALSSAAYAAWNARLPKGTRIRATFELVLGEERESFELVLASNCLVNVGPEGARIGAMCSGLLAALDGIRDGLPGMTPPRRYDGWKLDAETVKVEQAPASAKRSEVRALLLPLLTERF